MNAADVMHAHLERREKERARDADLRRRALEEILPALADRLVGHWAARRVWVFGSLAWGEVHEASDIDLAVEGLEEASYWAALADLLDRSAVPVDLVTLETAPAALRERIVREGRRLRGD